MSISWAPAVWAGIRRLFPAGWSAATGWTRNGLVAAGMGNAFSSFCMKIGSGIGTSALGWILTAGGDK